AVYIEGPEPFGLRAEARGAGGDDEGRLGPLVDAHGGHVQRPVSAVPGGQRPRERLRRHRLGDPLVAWARARVAADATLSAHSVAAASRWTSGVARAAREPSGERHQ